MYTTFIGGYILRLKYLREKSGKTMRETASELGLPYTTYINYEKELREPNSETLVMLANHYDVSVDYLIGRSENPVKEKLPTAEDFSRYGLRPITKKRVPLLGNIPCGEPKYAAEDIECYVEIGNDVKADFCLRAKGDSMIGARIHDGDLVFIRSTPQVDNGQIAAVIIDDEATLKRVYYYPENNMMILKPENSKYKDLIYIGDKLEPVRILGLAVGLGTETF